MAKRELIDTGKDKRYVWRNKQGQFNESDDVGRSLRQDVKQRAKTEVKSGQATEAIKSAMREKAPSTLTPQQRGAKTRRANLSAERRSEIGRLAAIKRWTGHRLVFPLGKDELVKYWSRELGFD